MTQVLTDINLPLPLVRKGKVRHVYDLGTDLLIIASDRVSAFDCILSPGIPDKGKILTRISKLWFDLIGHDIDHQLISDQVSHLPAELKPFHDQLEGRIMIVKKTKVIPVECVVRGYIIGSGWKDYQKTGAICGHHLPQGLRLADKLPNPIFTPATKADTGHDENISIKDMQDILGVDTTTYLEEKSLALYKWGSEYAAKRGIILADTKFEFGIIDGQIILIDEVMTPDSSRYWPMSNYAPGQSPPSFDKQIVRDYLESTDWDKEPPAPELPEHIVQKVRSRYLELETLLNQKAN
jgi:phosphoribosylaminoimidazole-succinocarboxamide synthase